MPRIPTLKSSIAIAPSIVGHFAPMAPAIERERGRTNQITRESHFRRDPYCVRCRSKGVFVAWTELDHIVPLAGGGTNDPSNRQGLCDDCHREKTADDLARYGVTR